MQGKILGNRYELVEKIGSGGMAHVYKAKCKLLNRFVAVKILRPEFINDEGFIKRFLIEAQSVARLSHPNIVPIYDVGHEEDTHYLVMEYVQGTTLKEYITSKGRLPWEDSVNIGIQICSAIEHAHKNHIVHRDIKPHNIIITNDGIAKVTDFGIARAASTSTITMVGNTIGSVHYFSPEQARGGYIGEKSDIYSLGICLYEMVTGNVPFDGETPVAVALKHIQEQPIEPKDINPAVPKALNELIMKAIKKEQDSRYQSATAMLQDLYRISKEPNGSFVIAQPATDQQTIRVDSIPETKATNKAEDMKEVGKNTTVKNKKTIWIALATSAVILITFIAIIYMIISPPNTSTGGFEIQNYVGMNFEKAKAQLEENKITVTVVKKDDDKSEKDTVIAQSVEPQKKLKPGGFIELTASNGPKMVKLPDLSKIEYRVAEGKLKELDLVSRMEEEFHDTIPEGFVTKTIPAPSPNEMIKAGSIVALYKSKGPEIKNTTVPNLKDMNRQQALAALSEAKLKVGVMLPEDTSISVGKVISQDPAPTTVVKENTPVNFTLEIPTPAPTPTPTPVVKKNTVAVKIILNSPEKYQDKIKVRVEYQLSDGKKMEILMDETKNKTDFPLTVNIPISDKGKTKVVVFLDNKQYDSFSTP